jgi:putative membrane protein
MSQNTPYVNQAEYDGFLKNALTLKGSITPRVIKKVMCVFFYSCSISFINYLDPFVFLPIGPFEYAGLIMGLILVFRLNAGYDRWWEARKLWGNIVNQSRNLAIIIANNTRTDDINAKLKVMNYITAMPFLVKNSLRSNDVIDEINHLVENVDLSNLIKSKNKPVILSSMIAQELNHFRHQNQLDPFSFLQAEQMRELTLDCHGACERILKTPIPFVMAVKSRRFIFLFLLALPFAIVSTSLYISPFITGVVAYALFSLDQIGVELQNPFSERNLSHLPLNDICISIEKNITEIRELTFDRRDFAKSDVAG